jgi:transposase
MAFQQTLTDAEVRVMRQMRSDGASYPKLAKKFEVHPKTIERMCRGFDRADAGGVIEEAPGRPSGDHPYDPQR